MIKKYDASRRLLEIRDLASMTNRDLAIILGVNETTIWKYLKDDPTKHLKPNQAQALESVGINYGYLLGDHNFLLNNISLSEMRKNVKDLVAKLKSIKLVGAA